ncbi:DUF2634 domain-containing protein [Peribacillus glennii]|uniref:DUF2634 domain-containing protein n=1 Tax=Peribacillus glennii TaxID=2303991 RepID=A0A372L7R6_9BACI|nr:DUF2634 domain-containing protein [Peribacillus glennii]
MIYSDEYSTELHDLIAEYMTPELLDSEIPRMVYETLAFDDRLEDVQDIEYTKEGDKLYISFRVVPVSGGVEFYAGGDFVMALKKTAEQAKVTADKALQKATDNDKDIERIQTTTKWAIGLTITSTL